MKIELEHELCIKYPKIFADYQEINGNRYFGLECGDGWYEIINSVCSVVQHRIDDIESRIEFATSHGDLQMLSRIKPVTQVVASQIKEKFGALRFYYRGGDSYIQGAVAIAENISGLTCEECGSSGTRRTGSWIKTLCDVHAVEWGYK